MPTFSMSDCILSGLKSVSGDGATQLLTTTCEEKLREVRNARAARVAAHFGKQLGDGESPKIELKWRDASTLYVVISNDSSSAMDITYVLLSFDYPIDPANDKPGGGTWCTERATTSVTTL